MILWICFMVFTVKTIISKNFYVYYQKNVLGHIFLLPKKSFTFLFLATKTIWNPKITKNEQWWKVMKSDLLHFLLSKQLFPKTFMFIIKKCFRAYFLFPKKSFTFLFFDNQNYMESKNKKITFHHLSFFILKKCLNKIIHPREVHS